jgi:hypothetical protein
MDTAFGVPSTVLGEHRCFEIVTPALPGSVPVI